MSRIEENEKLLNSLPVTFTGNKEDLQIKAELCRIKIDADISKSLAMIADSLARETELEDLHLRDNLLIGWILKHKDYITSGRIQEFIYNEWKKDMGDKLDGQRS